MSSPYANQYQQPYPPMANRYGPRFLSLNGLAWCTVIGLGVLALAYAFEALTGVGQLVSPELTFDNEEGGQESLWLGLQGIGLILRIFIYIGTVVVFLVWIYRASSNLPGLRVPHQENSPGWAIGWWFIPLANLFKPYQVVSELWRESDPEFDPNLGFLSRSTGGAPALLGFWWFFWLTSNFATNAAWRLSDSTMSDKDQILGLLFLFAGTLSLAAAIMAIFIVRGITSRQELRWRALAAMPQGQQQEPVLPPPPPPVFGRY